MGGDFYDVFADRDGCWLVVGDVCGKGAEAAVMTAFLRHTTVAYAREGERPANVLERVNQAMLEHDFDGRFATAILARLDFAPDGVALTVAAAGHPAALVSRRGRGTEELGTGGTLLGIFPDARIGEDSTRAARRRLARALHRRPRRGARARQDADGRGDDRRARRVRPRSPPRTRSPRCSGWST